MHTCTYAYICAGALPILEEALHPFGARAHWGKLGSQTVAPARLAELYGDKLGRFRSLCEEHDPEGKFRNEYVRQLLWAEPR